MAKDRIDVEGTLIRVSGDALVPFVESMGYGPAKRVGSEHRILCPFHNDHKPSLTINTRKRAVGIMWCPPCGWKGSIVDFVGDVFGISGDADGIPEFIRRIRKIAELTGGSNPERPSAVIPKRQVQRQGRVVETMGPRDVAAAWIELQERAVDPAPWAAKLGVEPAAFGLAGAIVVPHTVWTSQGWSRGDSDRMLLAMPMRRPDMVMLSAQFRCFTTRRKWALDQKEMIDGKLEQVKSTQGGLFLSTETPLLDFYHLITIEGMTDFLGGLSIMIRSFGTDMVEWPCQFAGVPGVNSQHDMLLELGAQRVTTFFDDDQAGRRAAFDHRAEVMEREANGEIRRDDQGKPVRKVDLATDRRPGLLSRYREKGVDARASHPPRVKGRKFDLRDMASAGWDYSRFEDHLLRTSTKDPLGMKFRR